MKIFLNLGNLGQYHSKRRRSEIKNGSENFFNLIYHYRPDKFSELTSKTA